MRLPICGIVELIGPDRIVQSCSIATGLFLEIVVVGVGHSGYNSNLSTQSTQQINFFFGLVVWHVDYATVASTITYVGESNAGIARGPFYHCAAWLQGTRFFRRVDHP